MLALQCAVCSQSTDGCVNVYHALYKCHIHHALTTSASMCIATYSCTHEQSNHCKLCFTCASRCHKPNGGPSLYILAHVHTYSLTWMHSCASLRFGQQQPPPYYSPTKPTKYTIHQSMYNRVTLIISQTRITTWRREFLVEFMTRNKFLTMPQIRLIGHNLTVIAQKMTMPIKC